MNTEHANQSTTPEPFGYFKAEPFGWTDCEKDDEGAVALYERPQAQPVARDVLMALAEEVRETCWQVGSGDATIREIDLAAIVDRHTAKPPAVATHIQELEAQLNAAILARREAQQVAQDAMEARNSAGAEIRRPLLKRIAELEAQQAAVAVPDATVGKLRLLVAACNRIEEEAEEFEGPDGLGMGIAMDYWHEFAEALTTARKALAAAQKGGA